MGYVALKTINVSGKILAPGQKVPEDVEWHGGSLRAAINTGLIKMCDAEPGVKAPKRAAESGSALCPKCSKKFKNARGLSLHARTHARG